MKEEEIGVELDRLLLSRGNTKIEDRYRIKAKEILRDEVLKEDIAHYLYIIEETADNKRLKQEEEIMKQLDPYTNPDEYDFKNIVRKGVFNHTIKSTIEKLAKL